MVGSCRFPVRTVFVTAEVVSGCVPCVLLMPSVHEWYRDRSLVSAHEPMVGFAAVTWQIGVMLCLLLHGMDPK
jgi:hypothetical protein